MRIEGKARRRLAVAAAASRGASLGDPDSIGFRVPVAWEGEDEGLAGEAFGEVLVGKAELGRRSVRATLALRFDQTALEGGLSGCTFMAYLSGEGGEVATRKAHWTVTDSEGSDLVGAPEVVSWCKDLTLNRGAGPSLAVLTMQAEWDESPGSLMVVLTYEAVVDDGLVSGDGQLSSTYSMDWDDTPLIDILRMRSPCATSEGHPPKDA